MTSLIRWNWMHQNYIHYEISFTLCWQNIIIKTLFQLRSQALLFYPPAQAGPHLQVQGLPLVWMRNKWETQTTSKRRFWKCLQKESQTTSKCRAAKVPHPREEHSMIWIFMQRWPAFMWWIFLHQTIWHQTFKMIWINIINHLGSLCPFETLEREKMMSIYKLVAFFTW